ncbi:MAG: hypothetical protein ACHREM_05195 [Polyangiales bacterium]
MNKRLALISHLVIAVVAAGLTACPRPVEHCTHGESRCAESIVQVCDSDERWSDVMDCNGVAAQSGGPLVCGPFGDRDHSCIAAAGPARADGDTGAPLTMCMAAPPDGGAR